MPFAQTARRRPAARRRLAAALAGAVPFALAPGALAKALLGEPEVDRASDQYDGLWCPAEQIQMYDGSFVADGPRATFVFVATNHSVFTGDWRRERIDNVVVAPADVYAAHKHLPDSAFAAAFGCIEPNKNYFHFSDVPPGDLVFLEKFTAGPGPGWDMGDGAYANPGSSAPNALSLPVDTSGQSLGLGLDEVPTTVATTEVTIDGLVAGEAYVVSTWTQCADASVGNDLLIQVYGTEFFSLTAAAPDAGPGRGCAWGDADGDGDLDLHVTNHDAPSRFWRNDPRGFVDATASSGLSLTTHATGSHWVDADDDGDLDLYVASLGANRYFRNAGHALFSDATTPVLGDARQTVCMDWADVDNDGDLDAFLANVEADALLRNDGGGSFVDVASGDLLGSIRPIGCSFADYDNDGDADLFVTYNAAPNELFVNSGGTFVKATPALLAEPHATSTASWADHDDDGDLDVLITTRGEGNRLCRNDGGGAFVNVTPPALGAAGIITEGTWADWDNDGRIDAYLAHASGPNRLFRNDGGNAFGIQATGTVEDPGTTMATAWGDHDGDGDPDLCVVNFGANALYRNEFGTENAWLHVDLHGVVSNRFGVGAKVFVTAGGATRMREVGGDGGFRSQNSLTAGFGLGDATQADLVTVQWPSGIVQTLSAVPANQRITIVEASTGAPVAGTPGPRRPVLGAPAPNPFRGSCAVAFALPARADVELRILDVRGRVVRVLEAGVREPGEHRATWDGRDAAGRPAAAGLYFVEMRGGGVREARKTVRIAR